MINPHFYHDDQRRLDPFQTNANIKDQPMLFGKSGTALGETKAKSYNDYTKKFDNNCLKMGLRK